MTTQTSGHYSIKFANVDKYPTTVHVNWVRSGESSSYSTISYSIEVTGGCNTTQSIQTGFYVQINDTTVYDTGSSGTAKIALTNGVKKSATLNISHTEAKVFGIKIYTVNNKGAISQGTKKFGLPKLYPSNIPTRMRIDVVENASDNKLPYSTTETINGVTFTVNTDGSVTIDGTATANSDFYLHGIWNHRQYKLHFEGKHYIHLTDTGANFDRSAHMYIIKNGTSVLQDIYENAIYDFGSETDVTAVFIRVDKGLTVNNVTVYPMIAKSDIAIPYVKYNEGNSVKTIMNWTTFNNLATINKSYTTDFFNYVDGTYRLLYQYERFYTTQKVREIRHEMVIPPEVKLTDNSKLISSSINSDVVKFKIDLDVFAGVTISEAFYSMDYGKTWISIPLTSNNKAHKTFVKEIDLTWLDEIYLKLHGKNPVDEKEKVYIHEMPSTYKLRLNMSSHLRSATKNLYDCGSSMRGLQVEDITKGIPRELYYSYNELTGVWTFHGTATKDLTIKYSPRNVVMLTNDITDYILSIQYLSGDVTTNNGTYSVKFKNTIDNISAPIEKQTYIKSIHLTPTSDPDGIYDKHIDLLNDQHIYIKKDTVFNNFKIGIQLEPGSAVTDLVAYGLPNGFTRRAFMAHNNTTLRKIRRVYKR